MLHGNSYRTAAAVDPAAVHVMPLLLLLVAVCRRLIVDIREYFINSLDTMVPPLHCNCVLVLHAGCCHSYNYKFLMMLSISHCMARPAGAMILLPLTLCT